jgi:hypothetical protein
MKDSTKFALLSLLAAFTALAWLICGAVLGWQTHVIYGGCGTLIALAVLSIFCATFAAELFGGYARPVRRRGTYC